jgi:hypothetical protein
MACCLPAALGGLPHLIVTVMAIVPPFLLATMFWTDEQQNATLIQRAPSPDRGQVAEVYFFPVGAYSAGSGRIEVYLKYTGLPWIRREIYNLPVSYANKDTHDYLKWTDSDTLYIREKDREIRPGPVQWRIPFLIGLLLFVACYRGHPYALVFVGISGIGLIALVWWQKRRS